jgi:tetratricopeptide (TPR) repeat protein
MLSIYRFRLSTGLRRVAGAGVLLLLATRAHADEVQQHFDAGVKLYQEHKAEQALNEFDRALKGAPKDANILRWIGFLQLERQNYEAARDPLEQAAALDPNSVVAHMNLGNVYDGLKLYPKALDEFKKVARLKPDSADAFYDMGLIQSKLEHWTDSADSLRTAARLDAATAAKANSSHKEDPGIDDALGYALISNDDARGAVAAYQKAISLSPGTAEYYYHAALAWRRLADEKKAPREPALTNARHALKTAVERAPAVYDYVELYAEILFDLNSNGEAVEQFTRATELDKQQYNPVYNMAIAYSRMMRYADAEKTYARALTLVKAGDDAALRRNALNGLSTSLFKQGKFDEAIANLKNFTAEFPAETVGWVNLASAYRSKGDETAQVEALRSAIANGAGYANLPQLRAALGALYYKRDEGAAALEQYALANRTLPNNPELLNGLALTEEKLGKADDAIRDFQAAIKANPRFADAYNNLGVAYESRYRTSKDKADLERAVTSYDQALAIDPRHALARKNKDRFDRSRKP